MNKPNILQNSKGQYSIGKAGGAALILTGCTIGIIGACTHFSESLIHGVAYATLGASLFGIRRFTADKELSNQE